MAVNFGILSQGPSIGERFIQGQEAAEAASERNRLREMQMMQMDAQRENILAQREQRTAQAEDLRAKQARATERQQFLTNLGQQLQQGGFKLDRPTLGKVAQFGLQTGEDALVQFGMKGLQALDEEDLYQREIQRLGLGGASAPAAAPVQARPDAFTVPSLGGAPAPVNAMAVNRDMVQNMLMSPNPRVRAQGEALRKSLPEEFAPPEILRLLPAAAALQAGSADRKAVEARIEMLTKRPEPTKVSVTVPPQELKERGARGELLVKQYAEISDAARIAQRTIPALETQANILDSGFRTGFGTDVQKVGASVLAALGVSEAAKFATDAQTFLGAAQQAVLQRQLDQKGPQTEADAQRITQTGAQLGNTPEANRFLIDIAKAQLKRDIEQRNFYDKWWKTNKTYDGAEDAWFSGEGGRSLFDRPELKKYAPNRPSAAEQIPGRQAPATPSRTVVRTGTLNGRRVVQYSDGTTEYAN